MKKWLLFMMTTTLCLSLCACGQTADTQNTEQHSKPQKTAAKTDTAPKSGLKTLLSKNGEPSCNTEDGYYYLTSEIAELSDGNYGFYLMYMDFSSGREVYLCSTAGCRHDTLDCPAVLSYDDFPIFSTRLFILQDSLYILSREYDDDGSSSQNVVTIGDDSAVESSPAALYRANLDGTERQKIYTFDAGLTIEDMVIGNDEGIYLITKRLSTEKTEEATFTTSQERRLVFLNLSSLQMQEVCPMDFGDNISWSIVGCHGNEFILYGIDYGREISREEIWDDDVYRNLYNHSDTVYASLNENGGQLREICRQPNKYENSMQLNGDSMYLSSNENQNIEAINLETGEKKTLCTLPQNLMMYTFEDTLCCRDWNLGGENQTWYFVDTKTGEITQTPLVNQCNGWALEFCGETEDEALLIYDYDATGYGDGSYEIHQYKYALMKKADLFSGKENYRSIEMIGAGR
ncbi:MAG: hypothetical protein NC124_12275 [Clostridium sp.]|nr:hypothetical protein [Clostridium sp.]